jgi:hypothetical protein
MLRFALIIVVAIAVSCGALPRAWAQQSQPTCEGSMFEAWQFHAGAPISEPVAVASNGTVAVATHEGYIHAIAADGAFLWSYTVEGGLVSGVHDIRRGESGSNERFVAASYSGRIYSLYVNGRPHWVYQSKYRPERSAVFAGKGLFFFTNGRSMYALSSRAGLLWGAGLGAAVRSRLYVDTAGAVWMLTANRRIHRLRTPYFHDSWELASDEAQLIGTLGDGALVVDGESVRLLNPKGKSRWERDGVLAAALPRPASPKDLVAVLTNRRKLVWLDPKHGRPRGKPVAVEADWKLIGAAGQRALLRDELGRLWAVERMGARSYCRLGSAPVLPPAFDRQRTQLVVATGDGRVVGLRFEGS